MDKSDITATLVSRLVDEQFPQWRDLPVEAVEHDGWDNTTFRLGDKLLARLPSADHYAAQVNKEQRWLPFLAARLPLQVPQPVAQGAPGCGYPRAWSIYRWIEGEPAAIDRVADLRALAADLADFLSALYRIDPAGGPPPGEHNFFRGGPVGTYDAETTDAIGALAGELDARAATRVWNSALEATWLGSPVWVHGDVVASNLLVVDGRLSAVIDFGCCGVGDPACDLAIAWTLFHGESRAAFRAPLGLDDATWARARGWALWKALITLAYDVDAAALRFGWRTSARGIIDEVLAERP